MGPTSRNTTLQLCISDIPRLLTTPRKWGDHRICCNLRLRLPVSLQVRRTKTCPGSFPSLCSAQAAARPPTAAHHPPPPRCGSPVSLIHGGPLHLEPARTAIVFEVPGAETSHTLHATHELEQRGEIGEDSLQPGEVGAQAVCGWHSGRGQPCRDWEPGLGKEALGPGFPTPQQPTEPLLCTRNCSRQLQGGGFISCGPCWLPP